MINMARLCVSSFCCTNEPIRVDISLRAATIKVFFHTLLALLKLHVGAARSYNQHRAAAVGVLT